MGIEKPKPKKVQEARIAGDRKALQRMGQRGGEHTAIRKELHKEELEEIAAEQAKLYKLTDEGDVLPPETEE